MQRGEKNQPSFVSKKETVLSQVLGSPLRDIMILSVNTPDF
jgi:hypothetical protein